MKLDTKQKILLTLIIIALAYVVWQIYSMFSPGKTTAVTSVPVTTTPAASVNNPVQTENPNAIKPLTGVPTTSPKVSRPVAISSIPSAPPMHMVTISAPLSPTQAEYLRLLNRYQIEKMRRMVMEEEAAIANSQARIAVLNEQTAKITGSSQSNLVSMTQSVPTSSLGYQLVYIDYQSGQWTATLNIGGQLVEVIAGVRLSDGSKIIKIDQRGVVVRRGGTNYLLNFYGTTRLTSSGVAAAVTMPNNYSAPVARMQKPFIPANKPLAMPSKKPVQIACPPAKPCEPVKSEPNINNNMLPLTPATTAPVNPATVGTVPGNTKPLTIIPNNPATPTNTTTTKQEENKNPVINPQTPAAAPTNIYPIIPNQNPVPKSNHLQPQSLNNHAEKEKQLATTKTPTEPTSINPVIANQNSVSKSNVLSSQSLNNHTEKEKQLATTKTPTEPMSINPVIAHQNSVSKSNVLSSQSLNNHAEKEKQFVTMKAPIPNKTVEVKNLTEKNKSIYHEPSTNQENHPVNQEQHHQENVKSVIATNTAHEKVEKNENKTVALPAINFTQENRKSNEKANEIVAVKTHEETKRPEEHVTITPPAEKDAAQLKLVREESKRTAQPLIVASSTPKEVMPKSVSVNEPAKINPQPIFVQETKEMPAAAAQKNLEHPAVPLALTPAQKDKVVQLETMLAVKPTESDATEGKVDDQHLLSLPADHYTIQLMASDRLSELSSFSKNHHLDNNAYIYHTFYLGKDWYVLVYGVYLTEQEALKALPTLPVASEHSKPWVRSVASVHAAIKRQETEKTIANENSDGPVLRIN